MLGANANVPSTRSRWKILLFGMLAFWLSSCLVLDSVVMPSLYVSGMMSQPGFAIAGYSLFWIFNRVELFCAGSILTAILVLRYSAHPWHRPGQLCEVLALSLMAIVLIDTYGLTPQIGAMGMQLDWASLSLTTPIGMNAWQLGYWALELLKLGAVGTLLWRYVRPAFPVSQTTGHQSGLLEG